MPPRGKQVARRGRGGKSPSVVKTDNAAKNESGGDEGGDDNLVAVDWTTSDHEEEEDTAKEEKTQEDVKEDTEQNKENKEGDIELTAVDMIDDTEENLEKEQKSKGVEPKKEEKKEEKVDPDAPEKNLLTHVVKGPVRISVLSVSDMSNRDLQSLVTKSVKATIDFDDRKGTVTMWFSPRRTRKAIDILTSLARLKLSSDEISVACPRAFAALLATEKRRDKFPDFEGGQKKDKSAYCTNIPPDTTEEVLRAIFPECINVLIPTNEEGKNFGCAILEFKSGKDAAACVEGNTDVEVGDHKIKLGHCFPMPEYVVKKLEEERKSKSSVKEKRDRPERSTSKTSSRFSDIRNRSSMPVKRLGTRLTTTGRFGSNRTVGTRGRSNVGMNRSMGGMGRQGSFGNNMGPSSTGPSTEMLVSQMSALTNMVMTSQQKLAQQQNLVQQMASQNQSLLNMNSNMGGGGGMGSGMGGGGGRGFGDGDRDMMGGRDNMRDSFDRDRMDGGGRMGGRSSFGGGGMDGGGRMGGRDSFGGDGMDGGGRMGGRDSFGGGGMDGGGRDSFGGIGMGQRSRGRDNMDDFDSRGSMSNRRNTHVPGSITPGESACFKCGSEGHWARDCPNSSTNKGGMSGGDRGGGRHGGGGGVGPQAGDICNKCGQTGHWARECTSTSTGSRSRQSGGGGGSGATGPQPGDICNKCGETGHWARECPNPQAAPRGRQSNSRQSYGGRQELNRYDIDPPRISDDVPFMTGIASGGSQRFDDDFDSFHSSKRKSDYDDNRGSKRTNYGESHGGRRDSVRGGRDSGRGGGRDSGRGGRGGSYAGGDSGGGGGYSSNVYRGSQGRNAKQESPREKTWTSAQSKWEQYNAKQQPRSSGGYGNDSYGGDKYGDEDYY